MWLIIPLIYFLGWWQTGSLRQAFNGTIAWIIAFSIVALALLGLDIGGFSGLTATPDSPAAGIAILGGFIGMWISNYIWRRRGGDPPRNPGKWERSVRAMLGMDKKKKKKKKAKPAMQGQGPPPQQQIPPPPPPAQQPVAAAPMDAQYRPAPGSEQQQRPNQPQMPPQQQPAPPAQPAQAPYQQAAFQQAPAPAPPQQPQQPQAQPAPKKQARRNSPTADKYAKATGRALGAMFRGTDKKKNKSSNQNQ